MKSLNYNSLAACGVLALFAACSSDSGSSPSNGNGQQSGGSNEACSGAVVVSPSRAYVNNNVKLLIDEADMVVKSFDGTNFGVYVDEEMVIYTGDGQPFANGVNFAVLPRCEVNAVYDPSTGEISLESSSSVASTQSPASSSVSNSQNQGGVSSQGGQQGAFSSSVTGGDNVANSSNDNASTVNSSNDAVVEDASSSSWTPSKISDFRDIADYGEPPAEYTKDISNNGKLGWNSRYWDACKPHCSWISDGQEGKTDTTTQESYVAGMTTARNCNIHDVEVPTFTLGHAVEKYWFGYEGTNNACQVGATGTFTCTDMAPIAVNDQLSYAYVAGPGSATTCGKCFHLQYNGSFKSASENNAPKATHQALKGKHIIVMTSNIGHDVENGQFDLMVPGGGVGAFDALSTQVNGAGINWGAGFGGFLTECQNGQKCGYDSTLTCYQDCIRDMCEAAFGNAGFPNLLRGCLWFADWYMAADNPTYNWEEVECPQYLLDHYLTRINTSKSNNYKWHDDWSTYKEGDVLDTVYCWKDGENPNDPNGKGAGCNP